MAKGKGSNRSKSKPSAKVEDMKPKKDPKGGYQTIKLTSQANKIDSAPTTDLSSLNFAKFSK